MAWQRQRLIGPSVDRLSSINLFLMQTKIPSLHKACWADHTRTVNVLYRVKSEKKAQDHKSRAELLGNGHRSESNGLQPKTTHLQEKPLLDLTPKHQELPQRQKKGQGFIPEQIPAGGLVKVATNTDPALRDPSSTVIPNLVQSRTAQIPETSLAQRQAQDISGSPLKRKTGDRSARAPLLDTMTEEPWVKGSLLDRINSGDSNTGHTLGRI